MTEHIGLAKGCMCHECLRYLPGGCYGPVVDRTTFNRTKRHA